MKGETQERTIVVENDLYRVEFSNRGGVAKSWQLKKYMDDAKPRRVLDVVHPEGAWVGAGEPIAYITGSFQALADCETIFLQKLGPACVAAYNAWTMCADMPKSAFLAMDARHCAGQEMAEMMAYAASVGSARAKRKAEAAQEKATAGK